MVTLLNGAESVKSNGLGVCSKFYTLIDSIASRKFMIDLKLHAFQILPQQELN